MLLPAPPGEGQQWAAGEGHCWVPKAEEHTVGVNRAGPTPTQILAEGDWGHLLTIPYLIPSHSPEEKHMGW